MSLCTCSPDMPSDQTDTYCANFNNGRYIHPSKRLSVFYSTLYQLSSTVQAPVVSLILDDKDLALGSFDMHIISIWNEYYWCAKTSPSNLKGCQNSKVNYILFGAEQYNLDSPWFIGNRHSILHINLHIP